MRVTSNLIEKMALLFTETGYGSIFRSTITIQCTKCDSRNGFQGSFDNDMTKIKQFGTEKATLNDFVKHLKVSEAANGGMGLVIDPQLSSGNVYHQGNANKVNLLLLITTSQHKII